MKPENKIISGLWIARDSNLLSNMERMCIHSFCANGHDFHLYLYDDIANIPTDTVGGKVKVCDGNEILLESKIFTSRGPSENPSLAGFADWFRWELMRKKGGWYVDMDIACLRSFDFSEDIVFSSHDDVSANSAILKFPSDHPLTVQIAQACASPNRIVPWDSQRRIHRKWRRKFLYWSIPKNRDISNKRLGFGEAGGPEGFTLALKYFGIHQHIIPSVKFEPIHYMVARLMIDETLWEMEILASLLKNAYSIHWFNEGWVGREWDKNGTFAEHSPYEILKRRFLPEYK